MTSALATIDQLVVEARTSVASARDLIRGASTADQIGDASKRIKVAKEWVRVQGISAEMRSDLLRLEIACLQRAVALSALGVLPVATRPAAKKFATMNDSEIDDLISRYSSLSSPAGIIRRYLEDQEEAEGAAKGARDASDPSGWSDEEIDDVEHQVIREVNRQLISRNRLDESIAHVLDNAVGLEVGTTLEEITDEVILMLPPEASDLIARDRGFRRGVSEVCRDAIRKSPTYWIKDRFGGSLKLPAFVTVQRGSKFFRKPFQSASLGDLKIMLQLREDQLREDAAAIARLQDAVSSLSEVASSNRDKLTDLAERLR